MIEIRDSVSLSKYKIIKTKTLSLKAIIKRYPNVDLKISLYVRVYIKTIPWKFRILNPKSSRVIYP